MTQILIVEDDESINKLLRKNLELVGHTCVCIFDGESVLSILEMQTFGLVLLDILLPKLSGFQVMEQIKEEILYSKDDKIRFIMTSTIDEYEI